jgi:hypothetical protein
MLHIQKVAPPSGELTELTLSDRLIAMAEDAERAGFRMIAAQLVRLACEVFDEAAGGPRIS